MKLQTQEDWNKLLGTEADADRNLRLVAEGILFTCACTDASLIEPVARRLRAIWHAGHAAASNEVSE